MVEFNSPVCLEPNSHFAWHCCHGSVLGKCGSHNSIEESVHDKRSNMFGGAQWVLCEVDSTNQLLPGLPFHGGEEMGDCLRNLRQRNIHTYIMIYVRIDPPLMKDSFFGNMLKH